MEAAGASWRIVQSQTADSVARPLTQRPLTQVVVAVLLDSFYQAKQRELEQRAGDEMLVDLEARSRVHPLDPLLEDLAALFDTGRSLDVLLNELFVCFVKDDSCVLTFTKFRRGMLQLKKVRHKRQSHSLAEVMSRAERLSFANAVDPAVLAAQMCLARSAILSLRDFSPKQGHHCRKSNDPSAARESVLDW